MRAPRSSKASYPHGTCQILLTHSQQIGLAISDLIGEPQAWRANQLREVWEIERLYSDLSSKTPEDKQRSLHVLTVCRIVQSDGRHRESEP